MAEWHLRRAAPADADALASCIREAYAVYDERIADLPAVADGIAQDIESHRVWVIEIEDAVVGGIVLVLQEDCLLVANAGFEASGLYSNLIVGRELPAELQRMIRNTHSSNRGKMSLLRHTRTSRSAPHQWMRTLLMKHLSGPGEPAEPAQQLKAIK